MSGDCIRNWLQTHPLNNTEQLFAIFSNASAAEPFKAWQASANAQAPSPIWAKTIYAEWDAVMPYVGIVAADSQFLDWVATTESRDWGWLAVSSASLEVVVEYLRSLTLVKLPDGKAVFFRFWDGRYLLPILQSAEVKPAELLPVIGRCLINGQSVDIGGSALKTSKVFPWWEVSDSLLQHLGAEDASTQINNLMQWLSEEHPSLFEAFSESVLRRKVEMFLTAPGLPAGPKVELLEHLMRELD
ncbi:DUF4123 domain-containing protein [Pseudomonas arsenicoxydans]|uniref:DUF4123 domain-containing protein n=1 Tax=Pseudomonas arsenicoxydans TaxID=702115 RepID=A0A502HWN4_9PSED|nr:DUF4123 domain-containing protein [Pseudomonas arsenicoxydans]TPG77530.1 DUF4123 domain-containing protein [Pseudomonas arsenicoxydans]